MMGQKICCGFPALVLAALALSVAVAVGCGGGNGGDGEDGARLDAVTTLEIFANMARRVGGDRVEVTALLPSGADPHTFELAPGRVADIARSDVVFANGLGLEGNVLDVIQENAGGRIVELTEGLTVLDDNPHLWLDVRLAARYVERIRDALIDLDPAGRNDYEANAGAYLEELGDLDREMEAGVESIPPVSRKLVTFHDAYPYMATRYGFEVVAVVVPSPGQEPSARDVAELVETLTAENVPAVFKEPQFNADVLELAADEAGVRVLDLLSGAYAEGVESYVELMRFNLRQLQEGLGGG
jgi:ABC-type Zn uptake system ZnuABC Zn-binding protein ZnuA